MLASRLARAVGGARAAAPGAPAAALARALHGSSAALQAKKGKPAAAAGPAVVEKYDLTTQIPVNLMKEGDEPVYRADAEYPPWLWALADEPPLLDDLLMKGVEKLTQPELRRVLRLTSKKRIKARNLETAKAKDDGA